MEFRQRRAATENDRGNAISGEDTSFTKIIARALIFCVDSAGMQSTARNQQSSLACIMLIEFVEIIIAA